jgi:hypothetical protein
MINCVKSGRQIKKTQASNCLFAVVALTVNDRFDHGSVPAEASARSTHVYDMLHDAVRVVKSGVFPRR